jgi:serine protease
MQCKSYGIAITREKHMKENNFVKKALALAVLASTSYAANATEIKEVEQQATLNKNGKASFAQWRANEIANKRDYTDRLIVKFKDTVSANSVVPGLAKKSGLPLQMVKQYRNGKYAVSIGKAKKT